MASNPKQVTKDFTLARTSLIMGAYALAQKMRQGQPLTLLREPTSKINPNDVMVVFPTVGSNRKIGYLPLGLADEIAPLMDRGIKVIARKAPNVLYGVCQLAYVKPDDVVEQAVEQAPAVQPAAPAPAPAPESVAPEPPLPQMVAQRNLQLEQEREAEFGAPTQSDLAPTDVQRDLSEGVTQADLDAATELPPLGDSRRPHREDTTDDEPTSQDDAASPKGV